MFHITEMKSDNDQYKCHTKSVELRDDRTLDSIETFDFVMNSQFIPLMESND